MPACRGGGRARARRSELIMGLRRALDPRSWPGLEPVQTDGQLVTIRTRTELGSLPNLGPHDPLAGPLRPYM